MRALFLTLLLATPAQAEPVSARIESAETPGTCGAAALAPGRIVTAAHCLRPGAGTYSLRAPGAAPVPLAAITRHPLYGLIPPSPARFRYDLALAEAPDAAPPALPVGAPPAAGETLAVETWRRGEPAPARRDCPVLRADAGGAVLGCAVAAGHSGAPVLRMTAAGPELVAVVVARLEEGGGPAALAVPLAPRLDALREAAGAE